MYQLLALLQEVWNGVRGARRGGHFLLCGALNGWYRTSFLADLLAALPAESHSRLRAVQLGSEISLERSTPPAALHLCQPIDIAWLVCCHPHDRTDPVWLAHWNLARLFQSRDMM